ncbi:unnamed protein product [Caretta caretta]
MYTTGDNTKKLVVLVASKFPFRASSKLSLTSVGVDLAYKSGPLEGINFEVISEESMKLHEVPGSLLVKEDKRQQKGQTDSGLQGGWGPEAAPEVRVNTFVQMCVPVEQSRELLHYLWIPNQNSTYIYFILTHFIYCLMENTCVLIVMC